MAPSCLDMNQFRLFSELTRANQQEIAHMTRMQKVKKRQLVYQTGEPTAFVYLLMMGQVKTLKVDVQGRESILDILGPGDIFGERDILEANPRDTSAQSLEDSLIGAIAKADFVGYLRRCESFAATFIRYINHQLRKSQQRVEDHVFLTVPHRLARLLLSNRKPPGATDCLPSCSNLTHQNMANLVGCSRETVSTALGQFRRAGLVYFCNHAIIGINDRGLTDLLHSSNAAPPYRIAQRAATPHCNGVSALHLAVFGAHVARGKDIREDSTCSSRSPEGILSGPTSANGILT